MTKSMPFDPAAYATVAERITLFYARHPEGRIETELVRRTGREVVFKASVYRLASDERPAATGWAAEREGEGEINVVACLENTETSAVGRALANLGFTASRERPSLEEMAKTARAGMRRAALASSPIHRLTSEARRRGASADGDPPPNAEREASARSRLADATLDALRLLSVAQRGGLEPARVASLARRLRQGVSLHAIERLESFLRARLLADARSTRVKDASL